MNVWVVYTENPFGVEGVFVDQATALRFINTTWPNAEQLDDMTWKNGSTYIFLEEFEVVG